MSILDRRASWGFPDIESYPHFTTPASLLFAWLILIVTVGLKERRDGSDRFVCCISNQEVLLLGPRCVVLLGQKIASQYPLKTVNAHRGSVWDTRQKKAGTGNTLYSQLKLLKVF